MKKLDMRSDIPITIPMTDEQVTEKAKELIDALGIWGFDGTEIIAIARRMVKMMVDGYLVKVIKREIKPS